MISRYEMSSYSYNSADKKESLLSVQGGPNTCSGTYTVSKNGKVKTTQIKSCNDLEKVLSGKTTPKSVKGNARTVVKKKTVVK